MLSEERVRFERMVTRLLRVEGGNEDSLTHLVETTKEGQRDIVALLFLLQGWLEEEVSRADLWSVDE